MNNVVALQRYNEDSSIGDILKSGKSDPTDAPSTLAPTQIRYVGADEFDRFAAAFADVLSEQTSRYVESRWGAVRTERVLIGKRGEEFAGAVIVVFAVPGTDRGLAIVKWGPLWREKAGQIDVTCLRRALLAIKDEYVDRRGWYLSVQPCADPEFGEATVAALESLGFRQGSSPPNPERYLVNVAVGADELKASLEQKWRYNLKKSLKGDLEVKFVEAEEGYAAFMQLYEQMLDRKQFRDSSAIDTLKDLINNPEEIHRPKFVMAYADGRPTAGAVLSVSGERAVYLYGATDERALRLRAGYAMHGWIADWLCAQPDIHWYDLGGTDGDKGLHQFKKGFCGKLGTIVPTPPPYSRSRSALDSLLGRTIYMAHDVKAATTRTLHWAKGLLTD